MSRLAKKPIPLPNGVEMKKERECLVFAGPKGSLSLVPVVGVTVKSVDGGLLVEGGNNRLTGLSAALIKNAIEGVAKGFRKELELSGVGYRAKKEGNSLKLSLGFSSPVEYHIDEGVNVVVEENTHIIIEGVDKRQVGQVAAEIRRLRPPEPYKGKGIKYAGEVIRRKLGKAAKAGAGATK